MTGACTAALLNCAHRGFDSRRNDYRSVYAMYARDVLVVGDSNFDVTPVRKMMDVCDLRTDE